MMTVPLSYSENSHRLEIAGATKPTRRRGDSSLLSSTKRRGGITKSSASKEKRRTGTKANHVIDRTSPSLIASSQADEEGESSESKKDNKKPFDLEYVYKVVQYLDTPGSESQDADKMIFLVQALRLLVEGTASALEKKLDGMLRLFVNQKNGGKEKKVTVAVQREVRKSRLLGRVYVVLREDRKQVFKLSDKGDALHSGLEPDRTPRRQSQHLDRNLGAMSSHAVGGEEKVWDQYLWLGD
ncbi:hypothetical protein MMC22_005648 [Lobaria immixta]|nr:hypothetical protein [Lobaria immixta]